MAKYYLYFIFFSLILQWELCANVMNWSCRELALRHRSDEGLTLETSAFFFFSKFTAHRSRSMLVQVKVRTMNDWITILESPIIILCDTCLGCFCQKHCRGRKDCLEKQDSLWTDKTSYFILCGYRCDKAVTKNDTREVIRYHFTAVKWYHITSRAWIAQSNRL